MAVIIDRFAPEVILDRSHALRPMDADVVFWPYRWLVETPPLGFDDLPGRCVMLEQDAFGDFTTWGALLNGTWAPTFRRHGFDLLVFSGATSAEHFREVGIDVALVYKGASTKWFGDLGAERSGFCTFGTDYTSRVVMKRKLRRAQVPVGAFAAPYPELNEHLNRYLGMVTTVRSTRTRFGAIGRAAERVRRGTLVAEEPAPEPMMKFFEAAAAGCAVVTDWIPDLERLGFVEGESVVTFEDLDQCVERVRHLLAHRDEMARIGAAAAELVRARHGWHHRGAELEAAIFPSGD